MALRKAIETPHGAMADYWRIVEVNLNYAQRQAQVMVQGFVSEQARRAGKQALAGAQIVLEAAEFVPDGARAELYALLKAKPQFADAEDLLEGDASAEQPSE